MNVADLSLSGKDAMGVEIVDLYARKPPAYGVYRTARGVMAHFADDAALADAQRAGLARLNPLRGEINGLIDGWRDRASGRARAERYDRRVADALVLGLEGDADGARRLLGGVRQDIVAERTEAGRAEYLAAALATGLGVLLVVLLATWVGDWHGAGLALWRAAAAGAGGAFLSIALAIRGRTVLPDLQRGANLIDAVLRMLIGAICGPVLMGLILSGLVTLTLGGARFGPDLPWIEVLVAGFVAGFSERFVPDLLGKAAADPGESEDRVTRDVDLPAASGGVA